MSDVQTTSHWPTLKQNSRRRHAEKWDWLYELRRFLKRCGGTNCTSWSIRTVNLLLFTSVVRKINLQAGKLPGSWHLSWLSAETKPQQWRWVFPVMCRDKKKNTFLHISLRHQRKVLLKSVISAFPFFRESSPWNALHNSIQISRMVRLLWLHSKCHINITLAVTVNWLPGPGGSLPGIFPQQLPKVAAASRFKPSAGCTKGSSAITSQLWYLHSVLFRNRTVTHTELLDCFYLILVFDAPV